VRLTQPYRMNLHPRPFALAACVTGLGAALFAGCVNVRTAPIEVKPIHITVDVNVKVERALEDFFGNLDAQSATLQPTANPEPKS
jgi:hypothetical protein